jgi:hypothetical protein
MNEFLEAIDILVALYRDSEGVSFAFDETVQLKGGFVT